MVACFANPFLEFAIGAAYFLNNHEQHSTFICGQPEAWKVKGVEYIFDAVAEIDPKERIVKFAGGASPIAYRAIIINTGSRMPLIMPRLGDSFAERVAEVKKVSGAIAAAEVVLFNGGGTIGVEMAGDCRAKHPTKRIILLTRDGSVLSKSHPPEMQARVLDVLKRVMKVEVVQGAAPRDWLEPRFAAGSMPITGNPDNVSELKFDFYMPCFAQGPRNEMLKGSAALDRRGLIAVNEYLQSTTYPSLFGTNTTSLQLVGHPIISRVEAAAATCAKNALLHVSGKPVQPHVDRGAPSPLLRPLNIKIGHGPGGYMIWDTDVYPLFLKLCVFCVPCKCGFPFWPLPCCWCCAPGCSRACGDCGGSPEGEGPAMFMPFLLKQFMKTHNFNGAGTAPTAPTGETIARA